MDKQYMISTLEAYTNYSYEYLKNLTLEQITQLYKEKVVVKK